MNTNIPVKIMRVDDFEKIATPIRKAQVQTLDFSEFVYKSDALELMRRYEKETSQILERKHFVNPMGDPGDLHVLSDDGYKDGRAQWEQHQSQLVFEGFKDNTPTGVGKAKCIVFNNIENHVSIIFGATLTTLHINGFNNGLNPTIYDFIYHISKYN